MGQLFVTGTDTMRMGQVPSLTRTNVTYTDLSLMRTNTRSIGQSLIHLGNLLLNLLFDCVLDLIG